MALTYFEEDKRTVSINRQQLNDAFNFLNQAVKLAAEKAEEEIKIAWQESINTTFNRPIGGRGFTDDTVTLRPSIQFIIKTLSDEVVLTASSDIPYAFYVETIRNGTFAYLEPSAQEILPKAIEIIHEKCNAATVVEIGKSTSTVSSFLKDAQPIRF